MSKKQPFQRMHCRIIVGILIVGFMLFLFMPKIEVSEEEKRQLTTFPIFSLEDFLKKDYANQFNQYVNDTFPFRAQLMELHANYSELKGIRVGTDDIQIYNISNEGE